MSEVATVVVFAGLGIIMLILVGAIILIRGSFKD